MLDWLGRRLTWCSRPKTVRTVGVLLSLGIVPGLTDVSSAQSGTVDRFKSDSALHRAAHRGDVVSLQRELDAGADPNGINRFGVTSLSLACTCGHVAAINVLSLIHIS